jgi:aryl-alcohol dehydrogenase-like predicted oxidoreductase
MAGRMVVGSKGGHPPLDNSVPARLRPEQIGCDLAESLERLQQPAIDLYWLHRDDPQVPCAEILSVLDEHRRAGRIRAYGASNWSTARLEHSAQEASRLGLPGFVASQIGWSLAEVVPERIPPGGMLFMDAPTMAWHRRSTLPVIAYSSQANGYFSKSAPPWLYDAPANRQRLVAVQALARQHGCSANAVALAWLLAHPCAGGAIVGSRTVAQLEDSCRAEALTFTPEQWSSLDF